MGSSAADADGGGDSHRAYRRNARGSRALDEAAARQAHAVRGRSRSLKPLALELAVATHEIVRMPPAAGVLTALGEVRLSIGRWDRPRATGGEPEGHGESEGANHPPRVTALARGGQAAWRASGGSMWSLVLVRHATG